MEKKGYRKGRDLGDWRVGEVFVGDVKIRDTGEAESKPLLCVCVYRVCTCGCMHNAYVTGLCRWLSCVFMSVYTVQGWDMETPHGSVCFSGLLCVHGCVLSSVFVTTGSTNDRTPPVPVPLPSPVHLPGACVGVLGSLCRWPPCTCDLFLRSWHFVSFLQGLCKATSGLLPPLRKLSVPIENFSGFKLKAFTPLLELHVCESGGWPRFPGRRVRRPHLRNAEERLGRAVAGLGDRRLVNTRAPHISFYLFCFPGGRHRCW